jgi:indole-3-glycerol phosphate synthase
MSELRRIISSTREDVARRRDATPAAALEQAARERGELIRPFAAALRGPQIALIAEHKRRSPSAGAIRVDLPIESVLAAYERGGAAALSILTEGPNFGGSLDDLRAARAATDSPILRKDFIVDGYQLSEALVAGADAILLIVAALERSELESLHEQALGLGLSALVEVHDERELDLALSLGAELIGINNRDLTTLSVDTARTYELVPRVPAGVTVVAESGFRARDELEQLEHAGVHAVLVGEALMRSSDIESACRALTL